MDKVLLQSVINKYFLKNNIPTTKWDIEDQQLIIKFMTPTNDMIGSLKMSDFPLEDTKFVIYDSEQLLKLINILDKEIDLSLTKNGMLALKLHITDDKFKQTYFLSDIMLAPKVGKVKNIGPFDFEIDISDHYTYLIKAKDSLPNSNRLTLVAEKSEVKFIFGDDNDFSNKVEYSISLTTPNKIPCKLPFSSDIFKEILIANKDLSSGRVSINSKGLMRLEFANDDNTLSTEYNLLRVSN